MTKKFKNSIEPFYESLIIDVKAIINNGIMKHMMLLIILLFKHTGILVGESLKKNRMVKLEHNMVKKLSMLCPMN